MKRDGLRGIYRLHVETATGRAEGAPVAVLLQGHDPAVARRGGFGEASLTHEAQHLARQRHVHRRQGGQTLPLGGAHPAAGVPGGGGQAATAQPPAYGGSAPGEAPAPDREQSMDHLNSR